MAHARQIASRDEYLLNGVRIFSQVLGLSAQKALVQDLRDVAQKAPFFHPKTARGRKMSVQMTAAGHFGWVSDGKGYRYEPRHPSGGAWPPIPAALLALWQEFCPNARAPECCLINYYGQGARMGLHQDRDETDFDQPVLSLSLGDDALFRVGGTTRGGPTQSHWLRSGDVALLDGSARLAYHGIDRIRFGSSDLLSRAGRLNITLRVVR
ncbi:MAG: alpha-ketoglutarate-dependent dioxygenase AlkB [Mangrovicoccus sp.]|nr:alpha-ketoglutarate-dependent dioxygenase AlkB [Mangrovicoccus sp.]